MIKNNHNKIPAYAGMTEGNNNSFSSLRARHERSNLFFNLADCFGFDYKASQRRKPVSLIGSVVTFILLFLTSDLKAQFYSHALNISVAIPREVSNKAFSITYKGVAKTELDYKIYVAKNFYIGPGINYTRWQVDRVYVPKLKASMLNCFGAEIKLHYQYEISDRKILYLSSAFILNKQYYTKVIDSTLSKSSYNRYYNSFEPKIGILLFVQPNIAVDFNASFMFTGLNYNPTKTSFDKEYGYILPEQAKGNLNYFNLGIGLLVGFKGKRFADAQFPQFEDLPDNVLLPEQENQ